MKYQRNCAHSFESELSKTQPKGAKNETKNENEKCIIPLGKVKISFGKSLKYTCLIASVADILFFGTHWKTIDFFLQLFNFKFIKMLPYALWMLCYAMILVLCYIWYAVKTCGFYLLIISLRSSRSFPSDDSFRAEGAKNKNKTNWWRGEEFIIIIIIVTIIAVIIAPSPRNLSFTSRARLKKKRLLCR